MAAETERHTALVALLRVAGSGRRGIAVEHRADQGDLFRWLILNAHEGCGHRVVRAARRQVGGRQARKAEAGVQEQRPVLGNHHLVVGAFLTDANP